MRKKHELARDDFIAEALRTANDAIGDNEPTPQALAIIAALKSLRSPSIRVTGGNVDYLGNVQQAARAAHNEEIAPAATAGITTPLGRLKCTTFKRLWRGKRGERVAWYSEYTLDDAPISVREIRDAGLAQRPTTRNRQKKEPTK